MSFAIYLGQLEWAGGNEGRLLTTYPLKYVNPGGKGNLLRPTGMNQFNLERSKPPGRRGSETGKKEDTSPSVHGKME